MGLFGSKKKSKNLNFDGSICFKDMQKLVKKNKAIVVVPINIEIEGFNFYKIGDEVYAPIKKFDEKIPIYYKLTKIKFVTLSNANANDEVDYNVSIEFKKNDNIQFYSYDSCDEKTKANISSTLQDLVNIDVRNKEDLYKKKQENTSSKKTISKIIDVNKSISEEHKMNLAKVSQILNETKPKSIENKKNKNTEQTK